MAFLIKRLMTRLRLKRLKVFYRKFLEDAQLREQYKTTFWEKANLARSTFLKIQTGADKVKIEIYRDDARGGDYSLMHTKLLN